MWTLSAFADEISPDPQEQVDTLEAEGIRFLELRGAWGKNVLDLDDSELRRLQTLLRKRSMRVSSIASPIGKTPVGDPFEPQLERLRRALRLAERFEAPFVRVFSFYLPKGADPKKHRQEVLRRLGLMAAEALAAGITLLHENEKEIYGDTPERCLDILKGVASPALKAAWDPANFVQVGVIPYPEAFEMLREYLAYCHVKDAKKGSGEVVPAGQGNGCLRDTIAALKITGFHGFFSLEPHLAAAGRFDGFSGPKLFREAAGAFKALLREQGIEWA
jgi:sugar phosphate isomerase/epimerase